MSQVKNAVEQVIADRSCNRVAPAHAMIKEIYAKYRELYGNTHNVEAELNSLVKSYVILEHHTINSVAYTISGL